ncbi:MAG: hypothetical protein M1828_001747 [Chrysothrix sp. TS-e1954]|nr:MAG: hypothetical protein M1828_001747 [Chrysothrix sp. TS-e1954]
MSSAQIIDIREEAVDTCLREILQDTLKSSASNGHMISMPTLLLWDQKGLQKFEDVTHTPEYYLTNDEIHILEEYSSDIAGIIEPNSILVELGSGNLRKTKILLDALESQEKDVEYYALDVSKLELERTLAQVPIDTYRHIRCWGLLGTYDDGRRHLLENPAWREKKSYILSLGSTIGSFDRNDAAEFMKSFTSLNDDGEDGTKPGASGKVSMILGVDGCKNGDRVFRAYNDPVGNNHKFIKNGLSHGNNILGHEAFREDDWTIKGEWDDHSGTHTQFFVTTTDTTAEQHDFAEGDKMLAVKSVKYDEQDRETLYDAAAVEEKAAWQTKDKTYGIYVVEDEN